MQSAAGNNLSLVKTWPPFQTTSILPRLLLDFIFSMREISLELRQRRSIMNRRLVRILIIVFLAAFLPVGALCGDKVSFAVLSDIHYAIDGKDSGRKMLASGKAHLPSLLREISERNDIDFVVFTGDLFIDPYYPEMKELTGVLQSSLTKPYFVVPGNHDRPTDKQIKDGKKVFSLGEFVAAFKGHPYKNNDHAYWSADFKGYHLVCLDSTRADSWGGRITKEEMDWLKKDLQKNRGKYTIFFLHHPVVEFYPEVGFEREYFVENDKEITDLLRKNPQVKFVVAGHYHMPAALFRDGVHHILAPSIITYPCKYAIITVSDDEVTYRTFRIEDDQMIERAMNGLSEERSMRDKFDTDMQFINAAR